MKKLEELLKHLGASDVPAKGGFNRLNSMPLSSTRTLDVYENCGSYDIYVDEFGKGVVALNLWHTMDSMEAYCVLLDILREYNKLPPEFTP